MICSSLENPCSIKGTSGAICSVVLFREEAQVIAVAKILELIF
jgi:hypothetical protein